MAERKSAEDDFNPRHRIVGAVILVALAVIFLPMLLREQPPETRTIGAADSPVPDTRIVVAPAAPFTPDKEGRTATPVKSGEPPTGTRTVAVPVEPLMEKPALPPAPVAADVPPPAVKTESAPPEVIAKPASTAKTADKPAKVAPVAKGWVVQVGAFSQVDNAKRLQDKLEKKGYRVFLDPPLPAKGKTVRVDVGPYLDASQAKAAQARIQSEFGIQGIVRHQ